MDLNNILTTKEIEDKYGVKQSTIRTYIGRNQVIPKDKYVKIGNSWVIDADFAEKKWGHRIENKGEIYNNKPREIDNYKPLDLSDDELPF